MDGVLVTPLKRIAGPDGDVLHGLKAKADDLAGCGVVAVTVVLGRRQQNAQVRWV